LTDNFHAGLGAVNLHEVRQQPHLGGRKILEQGALRNQRMDLVREANRVAEVFEMRELLRAFGHPAPIMPNYLRRFLTPWASTPSRCWVSSQPRQASVMLWPKRSGRPGSRSLRPSTRCVSTITPTMRCSPAASCPAMSRAT